MSDLSALSKTLVTGLMVAVALLAGCDGTVESPDTDDNYPNSQQADRDAGTDADDVSDNSDAGGDDADGGGDETDAGDDADAGNGEDAGDAGDDDNNDDGPDIPMDEPGQFGDWCNDERTCEDGYYCHRDGDEPGFCTRGCSPEGSSCLGIPAPGTNAKCLFDHPDPEDEPFACAFLCVLDHDDHIHQYDCPPELTCEGAAGPGEGNRYCLP